MHRRYVSIWFRYLLTDWMVRCRPELKEVPFVFAAPERGRMVIKASSKAAAAKGIFMNMVVADCRAILPGLKVMDELPGKAEKLLLALAEWCLRYTPLVATDHPDSLILDVSGCAHLWGGESAYMTDIAAKFAGLGYHVHLAIADTIGAAWAVARYGKGEIIIEQSHQLDALMQLPPAALRLEESTVDRLAKLGLRHIGQLISIPRKALRRRFGEQLIARLRQAAGQEYEVMQPVCPAAPYQERLPCLEPIRTATGIEIALKRLLEKLCARMAKECMGARKCVFRCFRIDGNVQQLEIGTVRPSRSPEHLFRLFELKIATMHPALGFEVFVLEAIVVEELQAKQEAIWHTPDKNVQAVAELLDRIAGKIGVDAIHRYLPDEHYLPERSYKAAGSLGEKPATQWRTDLPRPLHLLPKPEKIEVTVPIPDYPPMLFIYKGTLHNVKKADGPERIEQEWWLNTGLYRDYYCIEDEQGARYWIFRSGAYDTNDPQWYVHGFFA